MLGSGFVDTFRHFHPSERFQFTFWDMKSGIVLLKFDCIIYADLRFSSCPQQECWLANRLYSGRPRLNDERGRLHDLGACTWQRPLPSCCRVGTSGKGGLELSHSSNCGEATSAIQDAGMFCGHVRMVRRGLTSHRMINRDSVASSQALRRHQEKVKQISRYCQVQKRHLEHSSARAQIRPILRPLRPRESRLLKVRKAPTF